MSNGLYFLLVFGYNWLYLMEMHSCFGKTVLLVYFFVGMYFALCIIRCAT